MTPDVKTTARDADPSGALVGGKPAPPTEAETAAANRWPPQVKYIVGNEACERFSYYGMKAILAIYITVVLLKTQDDATNIIALFSAANYFMPLLGAWVSDRYWGRYHTILWISLSYCVGHAILATSDLIPTVEGKSYALYAGLALIAFGSGGIKPCVSAFMGDQFKPEQRHLLQKAYAAFYWSINLGSFFSFFAIPFTRKHFGYGWAFGVPGIAMAIATFIFWRGTRFYVRVPPTRETKQAGFIKVFAAAYANQQGGGGTAFLNTLSSIVLPMIAIVGLAFVGFSHQMSASVRFINWTSLGCIGLWYLLTVALSLARRAELPDLFWLGARRQHSEAEVSAARSVSPILFVFALVPIFWALFDQTFSTWVLQGEKMTQPTIFGQTIGPEEMLAANPALVMILIPIMTWWLYPKLGRLVTPLRRMSAGMFLAGASYLIVAALQARIDAGAHLSILWQTVPYIVLTIAEVLVSTTGLEFAFREAAPQMKSIINGFWNLTITMGNLMVVGITKAFPGTGENAHSASVSSSRFMMYAGLTFVVAVLFSIIGAFYKYRDPAAAMGK
jgi:POT family proton-dependent oligopeptide transporter